MTITENTTLISFRQVIFVIFLAKPQNLVLAFYLLPCELDASILQCRELCRKTARGLRETTPNEAQPII